tara:strand:+ start:1274 stop:1588 length:315 start_codon:yes stop_codon:yes gene_type:complete
VKDKLKKGMKSMIEEYKLLKDGDMAVAGVGDLLIPPKKCEWLGWGGFAIVLGDWDHDGMEQDHWDLIHFKDNGVVKNAIINKHNLRVFCNRRNPDKRWKLYKGK